MPRKLYQMFLHWLPVEWRQLLLGDTIAESIMDRITANKEVITFGDKNMRRWKNEHRTS